MSIRSQRKDDHVRLALSQGEFANDFDLVRIIHQGLPNVDYDDINTEVKLYGRNFGYPFYINAMTGGSLKTLETNRKLALIAKKFNLIMAVGSQHAALDEPDLAASFTIVRETNPDGFIISNVSANTSLQRAQKAVDMIDADALGIHINVAQEITMDEGDREFSHWHQNIHDIVKGLSKPVIVKEVGFGMSQKTVGELIDLGVENIDVSGKGGTNFIWIENERSQNKRFDYLMDWGISPVESLLMNQRYMDDHNIMASGGVNTPLDVIKLLILGANAVGISGYFLKIAQLEEVEMFEEVERFLHEFKLIMILLGCKRVEDLKNVEIQLLGRLYERYEK